MDEVAQTFMITHDRVAPLRFQRDFYTEHSKSPIYVLYICIIYIIVYN